MKPYVYLVLVLCLCAISKSVATVDDERDDDLDADGDDEDVETASPTAAVRSACPKEFRDRCTCGLVTITEGSIVRRPYVTNCTNAGFRNATVLRALPVDTEILIFTGNNLTELPQNLLGNDGQKQYDKLREINLANNQINAIHGKTFHNVRNVTKLILDDNHLLITGTHFHGRMFSNFVKLEELYLRNAFGDSNKGLNFMEDLITMLTEANLIRLRVLRLDNNTIQSIPNPDVFCSLESLQYLHLSQNFLTDARVNTSCFKKMKMLDISDNFIANLNNETLEMYEKPKGTIFHLNMTRNPFRCDCEFLPFFQWIRKSQQSGTWLVGNKNFRCSTGYPPKIVGKVVSYLHEKDFQCPPTAAEDTEMHGYITASYAVLISLSLALIVLIGALIYSNRDNIASCWTFLSNSLAAKREYTSLEQDSKRVVQQLNTGEIDEVAV